jgi:NitT/TauT family transport system substrate-binding protein
VRIAKYPLVCYAPQYVCEELLGAEGFTDISFPDGAIIDSGTVAHELGQSKFDFAICIAAHFITGIDRGEPISIISGIHGGCFELCAQEGHPWDRRFEG